MERQKQAHAYATIVVLLWATVASAFKISLRYVDFLQLLCYASLVSTIALFFCVLIQGKLDLLKRYSKGDYIQSALLGFLNPFLYYLVLFKAYSLLPAQLAVPLNYTWPIMIVLLSIPLLKQTVRVTSILAILISFAGVFIISTQGNLAVLRLSNPTGISLALGSAVIWALYWIYNIKDTREEVTRLFTNFLFGLIYILIFVSLFSEITIPPTPGLLAVTYVGLFEMGITFILWLKALKLSETTARVSNLIYLAPFLSLVVIYFVLKERILPSTIIGLIFIVGGIVLQQYTVGIPKILEDRRRRKHAVR